jgi:hypothetical protein
MYFLRRHRVFQEIQGFVEVLCGNICHFEAKIARKIFFRLKKLKFTRFLGCMVHEKFFFFDFSKKFTISGARSS